MRLNMAINNLTPAQVKMVRHLAHLAESQLDASIAYYESKGAGPETLDSHKQRRDDVIDLWYRCVNVLEEEKAK